MHPAGPRTLPLPDGVIDLVAGEVRRAGLVVLLTPTETALLRYLGHRTGRAVSRDELLTEVWGYSPPVFRRSVEAAIHSLRIKTERSPLSPRHIKTVLGQGYCWDPATEVAIHQPVDRSLVGRQPELAAVVAALGPGMLDVVGGPGTGKSALVHKLARELEDGGRAVAWLDLGAAPAQARLKELLAHTLGLPAPSPEAVGPALLHALAARTDLLLVFDGCDDHVDQLGELLAELHAAGCRATLLATSRHPLELDGVREIVLGPLSETHAVRLLHTGALAAGASGLDVDDPLLVEIAAALDCLPLALSLAAPWLVPLRPAELRDRLMRRRELLTSRTPNPAASLRAVLDAAVASLTPETRRVAQCCGVFADSFDLVACDAVAGQASSPPVALALRELLARGLATHVDDAGPLRFRLDSSLRAAVAASVSDLPDAEALWSRLAEHTLARAQPLAWPWWGHDLADRLGELRHLLPDLLALGAKGLVDPVDLAHSSHPLLRIDGPALLHREMLEQAVATGRAGIWLHVALARQRRIDGDSSGADHVLSAAINAQSDPDAMVALCCERALLAASRADDVAAARAAKTALGLARGSVHALGTARSVLGFLALKRGDYAPAATHLQAAAACLQKTGDQEHAAAALIRLAHARLGALDPAGAQEALDSALDLDAHARRSRQGQLHFAQGRVHLAVGRHQAASRALAAGERWHAAIGQPRSSARCSVFGVWPDLEDFTFGVAMRQARQVLARVEGEGWPELIIEARTILGLAAWREGQLDEAALHLSHAAKAWDEAGDTGNAAYGHGLTAAVTAYIDPPTSDKHLARSDALASSGAEAGHSALRALVAAHRAIAMPGVKTHAQIRDTAAKALPEHPTPVLRVLAGLAGIPLRRHGE